MVKLMRILVFFDLPVGTKAERRAAAQFRKFLLSDGYHMVQFSVYARICSGVDSVELHGFRLRGVLPPRGSVRMLVITEKQYDRIAVLLGDRTREEETFSPMEQMMLF